MQTGRKLRSLELLSIRSVRIKFFLMTILATRNNRQLKDLVGIISSFLDSQMRQRPAFCVAILGKVRDKRHWLSILKQEKRPFNPRKQNQVCIWRKMMALAQCYLKWPMRNCWEKQMNKQMGKALRSHLRWRWIILIFRTIWLVYSPTRLYLIIILRLWKKFKMMRSLVKLLRLRTHHNFPLMKTKLETARMAALQALY